MKGLTACRVSAFGFGPSALLIGFACTVTGPHARAQSSSFAANAQHTAVYAAPAQRLNQVRWSTPVDLLSTYFTHYGAPLITPSNTVLVPVKFSTNLLVSTAFRISAFEGGTGRLKYTLTNDYLVGPLTNQNNGGFPIYQPVIAPPSSGPRLYYPGAGGTLIYVSNLDSDTPGAPVHQCFYTDLATYYSNSDGSTGFNNTVFINTPLTADTNGVVFFGFRVVGTAPAPLNTTNSGFARVAPDGTASYVLATLAANDARSGHDCPGSAPALSNDGATLYVPVKGPGNTSSNNYLLGLDSSTLATKYQVRLTDPVSGSPAWLDDDSTSSPMVGPDGDVFVGVLGNPDRDGRGFTLHFSADLQTQKPPSSFGWDYTPALVPATMVPYYTGPSSYLLLSKYNNYQCYGDGVNRVALLDPNATQLDWRPQYGQQVVMREIMTAIAPTPDDIYCSGTFPYAVREWCINSAAVNPATKSVFVPDEDSRLYRWDLAANSFSETIKLAIPNGEGYVPTVIGPDGTVYTILSQVLYAIGPLTNAAVAVFSSAPDLRTVVAGQPVTFTAVVSNLNGGGAIPTGTVTFQDVTYNKQTAVTNALSGALALSNGIAAVTTSTLRADTNYLGSHFIIAKYSGDANFPAGSATFVQKIHAYATATTLMSALAGSSNSVTFSATVASVPAGKGTPTGMLSFWDGSNSLAQLPLDTNGVASFTLTNFTPGSHSISARYASDTLFASSTGVPAITPPRLSGLFLPTNGAFQLAFTNATGASFLVFRSTNISLALSNWNSLGPATEFQPGHFQFTDPGTLSASRRFYYVRSP